MSQNKILIIVLVLILGVGGILLVREPKESVKDLVVTNPEMEPPTQGKLNGNPTTFAQAGTISFKENDPDVHGTPFFTFTNNVGSTTMTKLVFDPMSFCVTNNGGIPCIAMSVTYDIPFNNKNAIVEGISSTQENEVLVRKLYILQAGEEPRVPTVGQTFITWPQAESIIRSCGVKLVMQTHAHDVYLTIKDDTILRTVPPVMDDIFRIMREVEPTCGNVPQAME